MYSTQNGRGIKIIYVRHSAGHADERIDTSEADADTPKPGGGNNLLAQGLISSSETEYSTRSVGDSFVNIPIRVRFQPGIEDVETEAVEHLGNESGSGLLSVHTDSEGFHAPQEEEGVEGRKAVADGIDHKSDPFRKVLSVAHDDTGHKIVVTGQVLCCTVVNDVRTVFQRALEIRAHHRVVNHHDRVWSSLLYLGADLSEIDDLQQRVSRGLE